MPDEFVEYIQVPDNPASLPLDEIRENRKEWIEGWREVMLG